ncbi:hypothetical protein JX266_001364 [Neoarthrinium moseri]|nr:hypothetical protein JX266_001364 [Neoarthrinium moseri]
MKSSITIIALILGGLSGIQAAQGDIQGRAETPPPYCDSPDKPSASLYWTLDNIAALRREGKTCHTPPGCTRVACQWKSTIHVCNDKSTDVAPPCSQVADYAEHILNFCDPNFDRTHVQGLETDDENWYVMVGGSDC